MATMPENLKVSWNDTIPMKVEVTPDDFESFMTKPVPSGFVLDSENEFEAAVIKIVEMFRTKNGNYARPGMDIFQGLIDIAADAGLTPLVSGETLMAKHRLSVKRYLSTWLASKETDDGFLDRAVYSIINLCLYMREAQGA